MSSFWVDIESFFQGILFFLTIYHLITYYFVRDKSFLSYALYLIGLIVFLIPDTNNEISKYILEKNHFVFVKSIWFLQTVYSILYTIFSYYFLSLNTTKNKLSIALKKYIKLTAIVSTLVFIVDSIFFNSSFYIYYSLWFFIPIGLILFFFLLKQIRLLKNVVSWFYLAGITSLVFFSLITLYYTFRPYSSFMTSYEMNEAHFLLIGIFLEVIFHSIGLGYKNLNYIKERENSNKKLIEKLKDNQFLKEQINLELSQKIIEKNKEIKKAILEIEKNKTEEAKNQFKKEAQKLKIKSLLNQMNPHFIFNALNSIKLFIINNDAKNAVFYLNKFSKLIRKILNASTHTENTVKEELETLDLYINIENIRFSKEINYSVHISENLNTENIVVPSLILQPFIENAIWHGLSSKQGDKNIRISLEKTLEGFLQIKIQDNGIGRSASSKLRQNRTLKRKSVGIDITKERLQNFTKNLTNKFTLTYIDLLDENKNALGTLVTLEIPLK